MSTLAVPVPRQERSAASQIALAGAAVAILDIGFLYLLWGVILHRIRALPLFQSVAEGVLGPAAYQGGMRTAALGAVLHVVISYGWTILFYLAVRGIPALRRTMRTTTGAVIVGLVAGAIVHFAMQLVVLPLSRAQPTPFGTLFYWVDVVQHMLFVGLPMALIIRDGEPR